MNKFVVIALFACVAVSHAAFTANLAQRVSPIVNQALFKARLASGRSNSNLQTTIAQQLSEQANNLANQINDAIANGQAVAAEIVSNLQSTWAALQQLGVSTVSAGQDVIQNLLGNLMNSLFGNGRSLGTQVDNLVGQLNTQVQNVAGQVSQVAGNLLNQAQTHLNGLVGQLQGYISQAVNFLNHFNLQDLLNSVAGNLFNLNGRGILDQLFQLGSQSWAEVQAAFQNIVNQATVGFAEAQQIAEQLVNGGIATIQQITSEAAEATMEAIRPFQHDLGALYGQLHALFAQIGKN